MRYGVLIQDIDKTTFDHLGYYGVEPKQYVGSKAGDVFTFEDKVTSFFWSKSIEGCRGTQGLSGSNAAYLPTFVMAEISESEYTRLKALKEPKPKEMTVAEIEEKLGYSVKIIK